MEIQQTFLEGERDYARAQLLGDGEARDRFQESVEIDEYLVESDLDDPNIMSDRKAILRIRQNNLKHVREALDTQAEKSAWELLECAEEFADFGLNAHITLAAIADARAKIKSAFPDPHLIVEIARQYSVSKEGAVFMVKTAARFCDLVDIPTEISMSEAPELQERVRSELTRVLDFVLGKTNLQGEKVDGQS